jgi:glucose-1-phosphate thymidylyltransferase
VELAVPIRCIRVEIAKALILATKTPHERPWPSVRSGPKHLVPIANRPILFHHLESLRRSGLLEATIVLEDGSGSATMAAVGDGSKWGLSVGYAHCASDTGLRGALTAAREFIGDEPVLIEPAGALHRENIHPHIAAFANERLDAMMLTISSPAGAMDAPTGYLFSRKAVSILLESRGTQPDPASDVRRQGGHVRGQHIDGCVPCHGGQDRLLEGNRHMLEQMTPDVAAAAFSTCEFQGPVRVHPTAQLEHTLIRGPAVVGPRSRLSHAYVGPYTSIGADVTIEGSQIEHSIVLDSAELRHVGSRLETSVIGRGARVSRSFGLPTAMSLSVGDQAEVSLS